MGSRIGEDDQRRLEALAPWTVITRTSFPAGRDRAGRRPFPARARRETGRAKRFRCFRTQGRCSSARRSDRARPFRAANRAFDGHSSAPRGSFHRNNEGVVKSAIRSSSANAPWADWNALIRDFCRSSRQRALSVPGERPELILVPPNQRRDEQAGEAKIVVRLNGELQLRAGPGRQAARGGEAGRLRLARQPKQPRHDQGSEFATARTSTRTSPGVRASPGEAKYGASRTSSRIRSASASAYCRARSVIQLSSPSSPSSSNSARRLPQLDLPGPIAVMRDMRRRRLGKR